MSDRPLPPRWPVWKVLGVVLATVVAIGGLAVLAYVVLIFIAMSQFGSNK